MNTIDDTPDARCADGREFWTEIVAGVAEQSAAAERVATPQESNAAAEVTDNDASVAGADDAADAAADDADAEATDDESEPAEDGDAAVPDAQAGDASTDASAQAADVEADTNADADDADDDFFAGLEPDARGMSRMLLDEQIALLIVDAGLLMPASEFIRAVRAEAGFRVSPREIAVAAEQLVAGRRPLTVKSVAELVAAGRGTRSERQQRHADDWRAFGALLLVRNLDGSPEGAARVHRAGTPGGWRARHRPAAAAHRAGGWQHASGADPDLVGKVAQALSRIWQDLSAEGFVQAAQRTARRIDRENRRPMRGGSVQMDPNVRRTKRKKRSQR